jgi:hypothetical protein
MKRAFFEKESSGRKIKTRLAFRERRKIKTFKESSGRK